MDIKQKMHHNRAMVFCMVLCIAFCMTVATGCSKEAQNTDVSAVSQTETQQDAAQIEDGIYIMLYMLNEDSWETEIDADTEDADAELTTTVVAEISEKDLNAYSISNDG